LSLDHVSNMGRTLLYLREPVVSQNGFKLQVEYIPWVIHHPSFPVSLETSMEVKIRMIIL
jgi:hypothetical protein